MLLRWRRRTDHPSERTHHAAHYPQHQPASSAAPVAPHLSPAPSDQDFGLSFDGGCGGRIGTPLLGADLRLSGDGGFSGFSSALKGRQASLPLGGALHSDSALPEDVLRMLTFGRLSPLPGGAADAAGPRHAAPAGLLSPLWNPAQPAAPLTGATCSPPAKGEPKCFAGTPIIRGCGLHDDCIPATIRHDAH